MSKDCHIVVDDDMTYISLFTKSAISDIDNSLIIEYHHHHHHHHHHDRISRPEVETYLLKLNKIFPIYHCYHDVVNIICINALEWLNARISAQKSGVFCYVIWYTNTQSPYNRIERERIGMSKADIVLIGWM